MESITNSNRFNEAIISFVIPCRNEEYFIKDTVTSILNQKDINKNFEIIIVDGQSEDDTLKILSELQNQDERVIVLNNPLRITPTALNIGVKKAKGDYIFILGAHAKIEEDYATNILKIFEEHPEVSCAGGPILSKGKTPIAKAIAIAMSSPIGVGNAKHRFPEYEGYAEMACFPAFRKEVFGKIGYFDEKLIRNQDDDFCFRLRLNGDKVYLSTKAKSIYFVRDSLKKLFKQYYHYGYWRIQLLAKHKLPIALRQQVPFIFFSLVLLLIIISISLKNLSIGLILPLLYTSALIIYSLYVFLIERKLYLLWLPVIIFTLHFSYALGFAAALLEKIIHKLFK